MKDAFAQAGFNIVTNQYGHNWTWHFSQKEGSPWRDVRVRRAAGPASNPVRPRNAPSCEGSAAILRAAEVGPCDVTSSSSRARARPYWCR